MTMPDDATPAPLDERPPALPPANPSLMSSLDDEVVLWNPEPLEHFPMSSPHDTSDRRCFCGELLECPVATPAPPDAEQEAALMPLPSTLSERDAAQVRLNVAALLRAATPAPLLDPEDYDIGDNGAIIPRAPLDCPVCGGKAGIHQRHTPAPLDVCSYRGCGKPENDPVLVVPPPPPRWTYSTASPTRPTATPTRRAGWMRWRESVPPPPPRWTMFIAASGAPSASSMVLSRRFAAIGPPPPRCSAAMRRSIRGNP